MTSRMHHVVLSIALAIGLAVAGTGTALADWRGQDRHYKQDRDRHGHATHRDRHNRGFRGRSHRDRQVIIIPAQRHRHYRTPRHYGDDRWRAFAAITVKILDNMNESQKRAHRNARLQAATAPIGKRIIWSDTGASGSVTVIRDGVANTGEYCREFQQTVNVGGRTEQAYGTACRQADGAWEIVPTR